MSGLVSLHIFLLKPILAYLLRYSIQCLRHPDGVAYMAAKKYYIGVGGGSRRFLSVVEKDGKLFTTFG